MKGIKIYAPPERAAPVARFIDGLDARLRDKLIRQLIELPCTPRSALREPHYKHFALERYRELYELRERGKVLVRVIFTIQPNGEVILLHAFIKRQSRDTMQALEQSLNILLYRNKKPYRPGLLLRSRGLPAVSVCTAVRVLPRPCTGGKLQRRKAAAYKHYKSGELPSAQASH